MDKIKIDNQQFLEKLRELGLYIQDIENNKAYPNHLWEEMGYTAKDMLDSGYLNFVHPHDRPRLEKIQKEFLASNKEMVRELFRMKTKKGEWRWILSTCLSTECNEEGILTRYVGHDHDVTREIMAKNEVETLLATSKIITSQLDLSETVKNILEQAKKVLEFTSASVQFLEKNRLEIIGEIGFPCEGSPMGMRIDINKNTPNEEVIEKKKSTIINKDLNKVFTEFHDYSEKEIKSWMGIPLINKGRVIGMMTFDHTREGAFHPDDQRLAEAFANQVAIALENARLYEETKALANCDPLTGCFTRNYLYLCLRKQIAMARRLKYDLSILLFDIDDFKAINDNHGHMTGDRVLRKVVQVAEAILRDTDVLCRFGGEEFVVLLPSSCFQTAGKIAERVRSAIYTEAILPEVGHPVSVSVGYTMYRESDYDDMDKFLDRADQAMYMAKGKGKNRICGI